MTWLKRKASVAEFRETLIEAIGSVTSEAGGYPIASTAKLIRTERGALRASALIEGAA